MSLSSNSEKDTSKLQWLTGQKKFLIDYFFLQEDAVLLNNDILFERSINQVFADPETVKMLNKIKPKKLKEVLKIFFEMKGE